MKLTDYILHIPTGPAMPAWGRTQAERDSDSHPFDHRAEREREFRREKCATGIEQEQQMDPDNLLRIDAAEFVALSRDLRQRGERLAKAMSGETLAVEVDGTFYQLERVHCCAPGEAPVRVKPIRFLG